MMNTTEQTIDTRPKQARPLVSTSKTAKSAEQTTPECELMSVEEYFGILRERVNEYYDNL